MLELKSLKTNMMRLHQRIQTLNELAVTGDTTGADLEQALRDVGEQLAIHHEDLTFVATVLGNGSGASEEAVQPPTASAGSGAQASVQGAPVSPAGSVEATYRAQAEAQIAAGQHAS